ncbi:hypothetical protein [Limnoglobus roseus]|uniref:Uncharacterized protein n=1 Tax=Limnoglobus roseus TaxID=2598579 RepID=A0A5C1AKJ6_9BACT|nr:hypothetical protein [Limnoglobus roseus]QEL18687.1 hypothetical protein PX52LOC_05722 [Limnoglobus roseus]
MSPPKPLEGYTSYKGIPPLAGLCSMADALKPGLSVEECVRWLKRFHYTFVRLHQILTARITAEPIYELKTAFSHHAYLCAEHAAALRTRVAEMREPPLGLDEVPHPALEAFFDEILNAPSTGELLTGLRLAFQMLDDTITVYQLHTHPLTDAPSKRLLRFANMEVDDMIAFYDSAIAAVDAKMTPDWYLTLIALLRESGGLDGTQESQSSGPLPRGYSKKPFQYDPIPQRDERFTDHWNQGVNAEAFLYSEQYPAKAKALMMLFKRIREIDVPEMMASVVAQTPGKQWGYYRDMARQIWDEARHAMMGEVGFVALGVDWTQARVTWNWSYRLNTECTPAERHAVLFFIEQGLMPKTGKRYEYEVAHESGIPLMATIQDFDWADEVLHSQIGRQWLVPEYGGLAAAMKYGDQCWSKILSNWTTVRDQGLTKHDNWWPAVYAQACAAAGEEPDPLVMGYAETYEAKRADVHRGGLVGE